MNWGLIVRGANKGLTRGLFALALNSPPEGQEVRHVPQRIPNSGSCTNWPRQLAKLFVDVGREWCGLLARVDTKLVNIAIVFRVVRRWPVCEQAGSSAITFPRCCLFCPSQPCRLKRVSTNTQPSPPFAGFSILKCISVQLALSLRCVDPVPRTTKPRAFHRPIPGTQGVIDSTC